MIPLLTEIAELLTAAVLLAMAAPHFKKKLCAGCMPEMQRVKSAGFDCVLLRGQL